MAIEPIRPHISHPGGEGRREQRRIDAARALVNDEAVERGGLFGESPLDLQGAGWL
jgi:hypothetical protein